ncbi:serine/threonine-protein kinase [Streptomyces sp. IB201691-2A2]|uniref:serine/threonine-protein kinase n=1 Tax=Streptomyces sp. IB201691-2A2 TaxID=2561920 RepID=UPI00117EA8CD|nr:serine/threonine-protein kinase [Streptomyces sp. IB201691-2A2]TRO59950.1 serine/threonine protein kinase [Streptomyces sp. IB201691-2A2]
MRSERGSGRLIAGRYLLHDILGRGGMGTVWRAHDQLLDRPVAVKELHILAHDDEEHRTRLRRTIREARAVARVPHPHVVGVHDLVESEDRLWIVMELVQGPSLAQHIVESGPLTPQHAASLGLQLLDALEAVHAAGTLHRDVKPANVLLRRDGNAVLTDFGIAALDDGEFLTTTGELIGSLEFMAPERVMGAEVGPASDLWSLGATLATVCGGQSPFRRPARPATLHAVAYQEPALSERLGPLRPVIEALLRKSPEERPTAASARSALWRVAAGEMDSGPLPSPTGHVSWPAPGLADADTMTSGRQHLVPAGQTGQTALHTTSLRPSPHPPSRPRGAKRLWWALAGTTVLAAGVGGGLFVTGVLPLTKDPITTTTRQAVKSTTGWQQVKGVSVRQGDRITVRFVSGQWTVDHVNIPMTGPAGYNAAIDQSLDGAKDCKIKPAAPFGTLLARLAGEKDRPIHSVGRKLTFKAAGNGTLQLAINDAADRCVHDNRGTVTVQVSVTHQP